jgi:hypothetical protein
MKRQSTKWEKMYASYPSDKGLIIRIYKKFRKLKSKKTNNSNHKWANELNRQFSKEVQNTNKYMRKCSISLP